MLDSAAAFLEMPKLLKALCVRARARVCVSACMLQESLSSIATFEIKYLWLNLLFVIYSAHLEY